MASKKLPIALMVDDGAPFNIMFWHDPRREHVFEIPNSFLADFARLCDAYGVRGKFSVMPMPGCMGRLDEKLSYLPQSHVDKFVDIVRREIAPNFDITPEILTHLNAYCLGEGGYRHMYEDVWVARASLAELTEYYALSLSILKKIRLGANGMTSPWNTGKTNELDMAKAIGAAQWQVNRRKVTWYFLHVIGKGPGRWPTVAWSNAKTGQKVYSIAVNTDDAFWGTQVHSARAAKQRAIQGVDSMLTADGKAGRIRELIDQSAPITLLTHWQSLFSQGTGAALWGLERLLDRIQRLLGDQVEWVRCSELIRDPRVTA